MALTGPEDGPAVNTLDRALWRAQRAIDLDHEGVADEDHVILSDILADLMHWAEAHEVNFEAALLTGKRSHDEELKDWALGATR